MVPKIFFFSFIKINILFTKCKFIWRIYKAVEALLKTKYIKIINQKEFAIVVQNENNKIFIVYIAALVRSIILPIYLLYKTYVTLLISMKNFAKDSNFLDIFFSDSIAKLLKHIRIYKHYINLLNHKQLPYIKLKASKAKDIEDLHRAQLG